MGSKMILLKNGLIFKDKQILKKDILIANCKIKKICADIKAKAKEIDCSGKLILPGVIDSHVHFREPGLTN